MKVLIVKMSSLGDIVHSLPAITDLAKLKPEIEIDWVVEESFVDIPALHPAIRRVIPVAIRRWRKSLFSNRQEIMDFRHQLKLSEYDVIVDAQGLMKSALVANMAQGAIHGLDRNSARESLASMFYGYRYNVAHGQHAVERLRQLFARIFDYDLAPLMLDYGINVRARRSHPRLLFLHGTTWASKHWPEERWCDLAEKAVQAGFHVLLPHGNRLEEHRAHRIADATNTKGRSGRDVRSGDERQVDVLPSGTLSELISEMSTCAGVVGVDTGLGHLAVAMEIPMIGIYGATNPVLTGPFGPRQEIVVSDNLTCIPCLKKECRYPRTDEWGKIHPPCYQDITADLVFDRLSSVMEEQR